tara:strand:+ start:358 stop:1203 length:846 start_codon:yes stop_codon:yes gene_type:complete
MKIIIIGLGLIGGSIAKSLSGLSNIKRIVAFDKNQSSIKNAIENKSIHENINSLDELKNSECENSLVIIATPPRTSIDILKSLSFLFNSSVTITDTTSTKCSLNEILQEFNYPKNIVFSHPVAGSHLSGEMNAVNDLFQDKSVILSYHDTASKIHVDRVTDLWNRMGSKVSVLDTELHDRIFAYSSHLPHVVSYALLKTLKGLDQQDLSIFSGGGLGEFLRLASSSPQMWADIFSMNKENIIPAIDDLINNLNILKNDINNDPDDLQVLLDELKAFKENNY